MQKPTTMAEDITRLIDERLTTTPSNILTDLKVLLDEKKDDEQTENELTWLLGKYFYRGYYTAIIEIKPQSLFKERNAEEL